MTTAEVVPVRSDFRSDGVRCAGWLYLPGGPTGTAGAHRPPVIVLAHGFSGVHATYYWRRAADYAAAGFAVFDFDPRHIGESDGSPRQVVSAARQLVDLRAAVAHVRTLPQVDHDRVVLSGTSLGGGLVTVLGRC